MIKMEMRIYDYVHIRHLQPKPSQFLSDRCPVRCKLALNVRTAFADPGVDEQNVRSCDYQVRVHVDPAFQIPLSSLKTTGDVDARQVKAVD